jgi:hypothetical protein
MIFNEHDHARLATLFCAGERRASGSYPGYRPEVREAPNGDTKACPECMGTGSRANGTDEMACRECAGYGRVPNVDVEKRFLHVALKYNPPAWAEAYLARAHWEASKVAVTLGVRKEYFPLPSDGTLRVLEYPPGSGTVEHKDFDLFTIVLWRSTPEDLQRTPSPGVMSVYCTEHDAAERLSPGLHIGELGELVGLGPATPHRVPPRPYSQKSIIYFAMPDHAAELPHPYTFEAQPGTDRVTVHTVGQWLKERIKRSRY